MTVKKTKNLDLKTSSKIVGPNKILKRKLFPLITDSKNRKIHVVRMPPAVPRDTFPHRKHLTTAQISLDLEIGDEKLN